MALQYRCRPSEFLGLTNSHEAFTVDRACATFGGTVKAELDSVTGKKKNVIQQKRDDILKRFIPEASSKESEGTLKRKFREPPRSL